MATIGSFTASSDGFTGTIKTLNLNVKAKIVKVERSSTPRLHLDCTRFAKGLRLAGTIQLERVSTVWRACGDETKTSSRASTGGAPNGAATN